jgi:hypothetical protein
MAADDPSTTGDTERDDLRDALILISELAEAMSDQIRRARRLLDSRPDADIAPGVFESLGELVDSVQRQSLTLVSGGPKPLEPARDRPGSAGMRSVVPVHGTTSTEKSARTLARDLKREGRPRDEVVRMLAEDFGLENVEHVVREVFDRA